MGRIALAYSGGLPNLSDRAEKRREKLSSIQPSEKLMSQVQAFFSDKLKQK